MVNKRLTAVVIGVVLLLIISNAITFIVAGGDDSTREFPDPPVAGEEDDYEEYKLLFEIMNILSEEYIEEINRARMIEGAIDGLLETLKDPQTNYLDPQEVEDFDVFVRGSFGGVGMQLIESEEGATVVEVLPETPAEEADIQPGDQIKYVGDEDVSEFDLDKIVELIRGEIGTQVILKVQRPGADDLIEFSMFRDEISSQTVESKWLEPELGYIEISQFDGNTGSKFIEKLEVLEKEGMEGLVLDLRGNPGGILGEALEVAEAIVPEGEIVSIVDREGEVEEVYHSSAQPRPYEIIVLIDETSASGAEILAGALQERADATLVGTPTYGKATVQEHVTFDDGSGMRYTVSRYVTPEGRDLHEEGINPDFEVALPPYLQYYNYFIPGELQKGDYGETVELLQDMLVALGYEIEIRGYFEQETQAALEDFQQEKGLPPHGKFDDITWINLRKELDEISDERDYQLQKAIELLKTGE